MGKSESAHTHGGREGAWDLDKQKKMEEHSG
jgi:hypothetical protein